MQIFQLKSNIKYDYAFSSYHWDLIGFYNIFINIFTIINEKAFVN